MRFPVLPALLFFLLCIAMDSVIYKEIIKRKGQGYISDTYKISSVLLTVLYLIIVCIPKRSCADGVLRFVMWGLFFYLSIYLPRIVFLLFQALSYVTIAFKRKRLQVFDKAGVLAAAVVFIFMWWGALITREDFEINKTDIPISYLPKSFDDFKIVQLSDLHLGTFGQDTTFIHEIVEEVNHSKPNLIVFTGDIVNRSSREAVPYVSILSRLKATNGVYAVLGNHDYGDYHDWSDEKERAQDADRLRKLMTQMGWKVLENETAWIHKESDSIAIVGVGNISRPPFRVYGNLVKAYPTLNDKNIKILLSHNPDHWTDEIKNNGDVNIQLTLSGHTHAMQFEVGGKSPAAIKYDNWGNLSEDSVGHLLYVNKGLGTEGVPCRIGAVPEITFLTLKAE